MKRASFATAIIIAILFILALPDSQASAARQYVAEDDNGLVIELEFPDPVSVPKTYRAGTTYHTLSVDGLGYIKDPGSPMMPVKGLLVGLPPSGTWSVRVISENTVQMERPIDVIPAPTHPLTDEMKDDANCICGPLDERFTVNQNVYSTDAYFPAVTLSEGFTGYIRDQRVGQILVYPLHYNPVRDKLRFTRSIVLRVDFEYDGPVFEDRIPFENNPRGDLWERMLSSTLANYDQTRLWPRMRNAGIPAADAPGKEGAPKSPDPVKITVMDEGIYRITYQDLDDLGLNPSSIDPTTFQLFNMGDELPVYVEGEGNGVFEPGEYIEFYGKPLKGRYSYANVYWLDYGQAAGLRMAAIDGTPGSGSIPWAFLDTVHMEENNHWFPAMPQWETTEIWEWAWIVAPDSFGIPFKLDGLSSAPRPAELKVRLQGRTQTDVNPDHHTKLYLNGTESDDLYWDGREAFEHSVLIPQSDLIEGFNTLTVTAPGDTGSSEDTVYLNWFEINYWRRYEAFEDALAFSAESDVTTLFRVTGFSDSTVAGYDITDHGDVRRIVNEQVLFENGAYVYVFEDDTDTSRRYLAMTDGQTLTPYEMEVDVPTSWADPSNEADYIIITHPDLGSQADQLALHHGSGVSPLRTEVVYTEDLYDEFNYGVPDPQAVRDFLTYAYANWQAPAPTYVLLLGDAHADYNDYLCYGKENHVPPSLLDSDIMGATPSDVPYSWVSGTDILPDLIVGRIPAEDATYAQNMVDKILDYEDAAPAAWHERAAFVADNNFTIFESSSEDMITALPANYTESRIYLGFNNPDDIRQQIIDSIDVGQLLVAYSGHGFVQNWAGELIFTSDDVGSLNNGSMMPFVMTFSCLNGYYAIVEERKAISEAYILPETNGAIGTLAPVGYTYRGDNALFAQEIFTEIFGNDVYDVAEAVTMSKITAYSTLGVAPEIVTLYNVLGDPALTLKVVETDLPDRPDEGEPHGTDDDEEPNPPDDDDTNPESHGSEDSCGGGQGEGTCGMI